MYVYVDQIFFSEINKFGDNKNNGIVNKIVVIPHALTYIYIYVLYIVCFTNYIYTYIHMYVYKFIIKEACEMRTEAEVAAK